MEFDFSGLGSAPTSDLPATHADLFTRLDRKATHTSLRPVQVAAFAALDAQLDQRDVVIKLSTGSGKTLVGLVYAERMRQRFRGEPAVYLCPTTQLVDQALRTASAIGVPAVTFPPSGLPFAALSGESVLVCTYDRLFNARSVFESRGIRPSAFVLDDAHAGIERVRGSYTALVPDACYEQIKALLLPLCEGTDPATWRGIDNASSMSRYEVPYWIWSGVQAQVGRLLEGHKDTDQLKFCWGNIGRYLEQARCCLSGTAVEISLPLPAVEENSAYANARHRLFMSASIKDGSSLIVDLGCSEQAFNRLIEPPEDAGVGERMILPTSLIAADVKKEEVALLCAVLSKQTNVVVLTSSGAQAVTWQKNGATPYQGKAVDGALDKLRASNSNYMVFAQRFDGVDLADDACRVLVVDGIPMGDRLCDQVDADRQKDSPEYDVRTVNRFEQALGRAVRSSADYAAVLLVGTDIAAFIGKKSVISLMEGRTQAQIDLGKQIAKLKPGQSVAAVLTGTVQGLLNRNETWKEAHRKQVARAPTTTRQDPTLTVFEKLALAYRAAWAAAKARNFQLAVQVLRTAGNDLTLHPVQKAELLYRAASYLHQFDPAAAAEAYRGVFQLNSDFPRPDKAADKKFSRVSSQAVAVREFLAEFASANAAIAKLDEIKAKLSFGQEADVVEQGLLALGTALGATSSRPEKLTNRGPDNLWLFDDIGLCIEAKSEKFSKIFKKDAAQLSLSLQWCADHVDMPKDAVLPVFATDVVDAERAEDVAFGPRVLNQSGAMNLADKLRQLIMGLTFDGPLFADPVDIGARLNQLGLSGRQILASLPRLA